jgi:hypothetical protein
MFRRVVIPAPIPDPARRPVPMKVVAGTQSLGVYENLAKELDYQPAQLLEEQIRRFLVENNIQVFDYDEVDRYLAHIAEDVKKVWIWRPLRKQDNPDWGEGWFAENGHLGWSGRAPKGHGDGTVFAGHGSCRPKEHAYRPYHHAVPAHVLRKVKTIQDKFGAQVKFLVSDYAVPKPDPFIAVTAHDVPRIIFDVWDEPGFGDTEI